MTMVMTNDSEDHEGQDELRNNRTFLFFVVYKYYTRVSFSFPRSSFFIPALFTHSVALAYSYSLLI